jgi:hypothetical protein
MRADFAGDYEGSLFKNELADAFDRVLEQMKRDLVVADPVTRWARSAGLVGFPL